MPKNIKYEEGLSSVTIFDGGRHFSASPGKEVQRGEVVEVSDELAERLLEQGWVEADAPTQTKAPEGKPGSQTGTTKSAGSTPAAPTKEDE